MNSIRFGLVIAALSLALLPGNAHALFATPDSARAFAFSLLEWDSTLVGTLDDADDTMLAQGYATTFYAQSALGGTDSLSQAFIEEIAEPFGAMAMFSHGVGPTSDSLSLVHGGEPAIQFYPNAGAAYTAYADLRSRGVVPDDSTIGVYSVTHRSTSVWAIVLLRRGIERYAQPRYAIMHLGICDGGYATTSWMTNGSATIATYAAGCQIDYGKADAATLWQIMGGASGAHSRTLASAASVTGLAITPDHGGDSLALAPWAIDIFPPNNYTIDGPQVAYVATDTDMDTTLPIPPMITPRGALEFWGGAPPAWTVSYSLDYKLFPSVTGDGYIDIDGSAIRSTGGIPLYFGTGDAGDTLTYYYKCKNPSNSGVWFDHLLATTGGSGNDINFSTLWEDSTGSFTVERVSGPGGSGSIPNITAVGGPGVYSAFDAGGSAGARYRIVEHLTNGRPDIAYEVFEAAPPESVCATESPCYDADSVATEVDEIGNPGAAVDTSSTSPGLYLLVAPDSLASSLGSYVSVWSAHGVTPGIVPVSNTASYGGIKGYIQWAYAHGTRYVLLVGDANDDSLWNDSSKWTNGWNWPRVPGGNHPHIPSQPGHNIIPTYYTLETVSPSHSMAGTTPYYATDLPYADIDNDGLPDLAVARLPVDNRTELLLYTNKLSAHLSVSPPSNPRTAFLTNAVDNGLVLGSHVLAQSDSVALEFLTGSNVSRRTNTNATLWEYARRESLADSVANTRPDRIVWLSSGSERDIYANFWRLDHGWSMSHLQPYTSGRYLISLGFSCGMGNFDQTESYTACDSMATGTATCTGPIRPIVERLLFDSIKGAISTIGPTRNTFQPANAMFARAVVRELSAGLDFGSAFMVAQRNCITQHPEYKDLFRSYVILGDPLPAGSMVTGVGGKAPEFRTGLGPARPNPFNPVTTLMVRLASNSAVDLRVFDIHGRLVRTLLKAQILRGGTTPVRWDGRNDQGNPVASGVYVARMGANRANYSQKLVLLK